ncbi:hypothetical protein, partial [Bacteroides sp. ET225]|uniref:hypothetical protein n=1 Tax=Bacteroides sp. ET225 TaxID=2972461 RepID=UPI0021ACEC09
KVAGKDSEWRSQRQMKREVFRFCVQSSWGKGAEKAGICIFPYGSVDSSAYFIDGLAYKDDAWE